MIYFPTLTESNVSQQVIDTFLGYNHNLKIADGEFYDMENLSSAHYPMLAVRAKRSAVTKLANPQGIIAKAALAYVDGDTLYYDGEPVAGLTLSTDADKCPKRLVSMGAYICIFPDNLFVNTADLSDSGAMYAFYAEQSVAVTYSPCKQDGTGIEISAASEQPPEEPENGAYWLDTSTEIHMLKQYNINSKEWIKVKSYVKVEAHGIEDGFRRGDIVEIDGLTGGAVSEHGEETLNGNKEICKIGLGYIVIGGLISGTLTKTEAAVRVSRDIPEMDFVVEAQNRLWGCKYGTVQGQVINEIYCCALGDFRTWRQYSGISTDAWAASCGTDGAFTGAVTYQGYPTFFKEHCMHRVGISPVGAHSLTDTACDGIKSGCGGSTAIVGNVLYYMSNSGVMAYDGSYPVCVSSALGRQPFSDAVAGTVDNKYYLSAKDVSGKQHLFVRDCNYGLWHREDATQAIGFARLGDALYILAADGALLCTDANAGTPEGALRWSATTGLTGYTTTGNKYISRFLLRMQLPLDAVMDIFAEYDSSGQWERLGHIKGKGTQTFLMPVRPRRCDHFRLRFDGIGAAKIYSFAKNFEQGSDIG